MSLQNVFESARKMGVPVIVTDPSGREPMVVLPLEQFEAMNGEEKARIPQNKPQFASPVFEPSIPSNFSEIPPEDRFYLEPVDDPAGAQG